MGLLSTVLGWTLLCFLFVDGALASLIASSEIQACSRTLNSIDPLSLNGERCQKKFVVSLAVQTGQVSQLKLSETNNLALLYIVAG